MRHEVVKNQAVIDAYVHIVGGSKDKDIRLVTQHQKSIAYIVFRLLENSLQRRMSRQERT